MSGTKVTAFLCDWGPYASLDLAGRAGLRYSPLLQVINVNCTGRLDPAHVVEVFMKGGDGVMVLGCKMGECHFENGNFHALKRMERIRRFLEKVGVSGERLYMEWVSIDEPERVVRLIEVFTGRVEGLGSLSGGDDWEMLRFELAVLKGVLEEETLRWLVGKELDFIEKGNVFEEPFDMARMEEIFEETLERGRLRRKILLKLEEKPSSVREVAQALDLPPYDILMSIVGLRKEGKVSLEKIEGKDPLYSFVK